MSKNLKKWNLIVGRCYQCLYPKHNFSGLSWESETRRIRVLAERDTKSEPVTQEWLDKRPTLERGRWLVICEDLDKGEQRQFYLHKMKCVRELEEQTPEPYMVVQFGRSQFKCEELPVAMAFVEGRRSGEIYGRMTGS